MDRDTRQRLVRKYKEGYQAVAEAVAGASEAELDARPAPEKWSAREIVHHLADSEMTSAILLERLTEAEWDREGTHTEHGRYAIEDWLRIYAEHAHNHADQIRLARASAGKSFTET